jgi:hypothetical protein
MIIIDRRDAYRHVTKQLSPWAWSRPVSQVCDGMTRPERRALLAAGAVAET